MKLRLTSPDSRPWGAPQRIPDAAARLSVVAIDHMRTPGMLLATAGVSAYFHGVMCVEEEGQLGICRFWPAPHLFHPDYGHDWACTPQLSSRLEEAGASIKTQEAKPLSLHSPPRWWEWKRFEREVGDCDLSAIRSRASVEGQGPLAVQWLKLHEAWGEEQAREENRKGGPGWNLDFALRVLQASRGNEELRHLIENKGAIRFEGSLLVMRVDVYTQVAELIDHRMFLVRRVAI